MVARGGDSGSLWGVSDTQPLANLLRAGTLDAELAALLWLLLEARTPAVAIGAGPGACDRVVGGLRGLLPETARLVDVAPDDDFEWLPEAEELGWRRDRPGQAVPVTGTLTAADGVLLARGLGAADGIAGARARIVVRALALGYGLLATMAGEGLEDALNTLHGPRSVPIPTSDRAWGSCSRWGTLPERAG